MTSAARLLIIGLMSATLPLSLASAQSVAKDDPRVQIASKLPGTKPEELRPSPIPGIYEFMRGTDIAYVSADGKYVIAGDMYDLGSNDNLSEQRRNGVRAKMISAVPESEMVVFGPKSAKHTITVFTDIDCGYCRQLHSQMADYNKLGIRVRYLSFPRTGPGSESWTKAERVWCAPNRNDALTRAKRGENLDVKPCDKAPVGRHYKLGQQLALQGTPAIVTASGEMLPGYIPPAALLQHLNGE